ncbi:ATP-binding protein [Helicobacter sp. UBA3407]|uniref:ATP-binding protein n=1 Tax=Helicobacter TaxID=209 RepID=UPI0026236BE5|nr:ATP-binding protein [Helicobacter sp. UBA3407]
MQTSFATKVTSKTIKQDSAIARLNPIGEAIKNAIDAGAKNINIYLNIHPSQLCGEEVSLIIEDDGSGFDCSNEQYMNEKWTHYKGGDYVPNTLGGRSRGRYTYLRFVDFRQENIKDIKIYTKFNDKYYCVTFCVENNNIGFYISEKKAEYQKEAITQLYIEQLGKKFINQRNLEELAKDLEKEIIVEFADKILKNISISINNKKINVEDYIDKREEKTYTLSNGKQFESYIIVWKNEIDLTDKKHTFLFNKMGNCLGKIPSGSQKSIFNCHTVFLTSDMFKDDYELLELDLEYKDLIKEMQKLYKPDLDKLLFQVWIKNKDMIASQLAQKNKLLPLVDDMIKEKIQEAYKILAVPLMLNEHNITKNNMSYFSNSLMGLISDNNSNTLTNLEIVFNLNESNQKIMSYVNQNLDILTLVKKYYGVLSKLDFLNNFENLVLNEGKQTTKERTELHKIINNHLWIFDETYSDLGFFSDQSLKGIFREVGLPMKFDDKELRKIPDIFIPQTTNNELILIELKAPRVEITHKILNEVLEKYILKILKALRKQNNSINFVRAICVSSQRGEDMPTLNGENYEIKATTWKELIEKRKKENRDKLQGITEELSLSNYKDIEDFKTKEMIKTQ